MSDFVKEIVKCPLCGEEMERIDVKPYLYKYYRCKGYHPETLNNEIKIIPYRGLE